MTDELPLVAAPTDETLRRAIDGDERAFATLYLDVQPRLWRYATSLVGADADDVTAEAWLQIIRDFNTFSGDLDDFRGWSARILRNRAIDSGRARTRRRAEPLPTGFDRVAPDDTALAALEGISTERAVQLVAGLPRERAEAVLLRAVVGLSVAATGELLGKSPGAVRVATHRGLTTLRRWVRAERRRRS